MATERQTAANRRNASRSTGPRTPEGRSASRLNGLVHGLRSQLIVIPGENPEEFHALFDGFVGEARPQSLRDLAAVRKIASCEWRLRRVAALENEMYAQTLHQAATLGSAPDAFSVAMEQLMADPSLPPQPPDASASPLTLIARRFLAGEINRFTALSRYEASLERQYRNAWRELDSRPLLESGSDSTATTQLEDIHWTCDPATGGQAPLDASRPIEPEPVAAAKPESERPNPIPKSDTPREPSHFEPANPEKEPPAPPQSIESLPVVETVPESAQPNPIPKSDTPAEPCQPAEIGPGGPRPEEIRDFLGSPPARAGLAAEETSDELDLAA